MKKVLLLTCFIIFIPYLIISLFIRDDEIKFKYVSNMVVRVKQTQNDKIIKVLFEDYIVKVNKIKQAVLETHNKYMEYNGKIVDAICSFIKHNVIIANNDTILAVSGL